METESGVDEQPEELFTQAAHDHHFLARLERVDAVRSDLALRLYREPELVRSILRDAACSPSAGRIAIPLEQGADPPHVVVARDGGFVTCLAAGMGLGEVPALPWARLEMHLARQELIDARLGRAQEVIRVADVRQLWARLGEAGARLTREEFQQLAALEPVLGHRYAAEAFRHSRMLASHQLLARTAKGRRDDEVRFLRCWWTAWHTTGHLLLLASLGGRHRIEGWIRPYGAAASMDTIHDLLVPYVSVGDPALALRAIWAIGRAGKLALPGLKRTMADGPHRPLWIAAALGLLAVARRHRRLAAEVDSTVNVGRLPPALQEDERARLVIETVKRFVWPPPPEEDNEVEEERRHRLAAGVALALAQNVESDPASHEEWAGDELMPTRLAQSQVPSLGRGGRAGFYVYGTMAVATLAPERFYLPAAEIRDAPEFSCQATMDLAGAGIRQPPVVRATPKTGRNDPCRCGSGKKFKRCCGE